MKIKKKKTFEESSIQKEEVYLEPMLASSRELFCEYN